MISRAAAPSSSTLTNLTSRSLRVQGQAARTFATVQDNAPPVRHHGGLQDQDRIFTNLYGHHGADLKSAMKYGDWHRTKDIVLKGDDWVGIRPFTMDHHPVVCSISDWFNTNAAFFSLNYSSSRNLKLLVFVVVVVLVSPQD